MAHLLPAHFLVITFQVKMLAIQLWVRALVLLITSQEAEQAAAQPPHAAAAIQAISGVGSVVEEMVQIELPPLRQTLPLAEPHIPAAGVEGAEVMVAQVLY